MATELEAAQDAALTAYLNELRNLIELAKLMREAQRTYFRTRTRSDLVTAKNLEVEFDQKAAQ